MPEDDPNQNNETSVSTTPEIEAVPRWGPQHAGAKTLASQYTVGTCDLSPHQVLSDVDRIYRGVIKKCMQRVIKSRSLDCHDLSLWLRWCRIKVDSLTFCGQLASLQHHEHVHPRLDQAGFTYEVVNIVIVQRMYGNMELHEIDISEWLDSLIKAIQQCI